MIIMRYVYDYSHDKANEISSRRLLLMHVPTGGGALSGGTQDWAKCPTDFPSKRKPFIPRGLLRAVLFARVALAFFCSIRSNVTVAAIQETSAIRGRAFGFRFEPERSLCYVLLINGDFTGKTDATKYDVLDARIRCQFGGGRTGNVCNQKIIGDGISAGVCELQRSHSDLPDLAAQRRAIPPGPLPNKPMGRASR